MTPVAVIENDQVYFIRTDHIGRPVFATDSNGTKVWQATYLPFGGVHTSSGDTIALRFPGQWFQSESGLHQNWMRDYDPTTGRYIQGDPLGLVDGASVYSYALQNPGRYTDPMGLYCVTSNGTTRCRTSGYDISWPKQSGWSDGNNFWPGSSNYHFYDKSRYNPDKLYDVECLLNGLINLPEPYPSNGASWDGTRNYANPGYAGGSFADSRGYNPVTSFIIRDRISGAIGTVNVTNEGHRLEDGYVVRFPTQHGILTFGEGNGFLQAPYNPAQIPINAVWGPANSRIMEQCECKNQ
nr:RHS repeat-associated core domain-containing protein [Pseudaestuariivita rosea]